ncbi:DUF1697 domain-containing protein [Paenibacillus sp. D2_2]|uniref:DUF1697 domain-containing protein n=1 Tax=Paenibacillus sp. D2_2 TaxID=3073092 RepID=UPI00281607E5|nr:DUF1697 domain-containing protein [Paenibacillus sp. D2_2]WMT40157.1 DUF1697 domain-containing protein [Paenibacillus sp. D2_2]
MAIYIALLRGINVGGKNKIKMDDLKRILTESGLKQVQTYIQSGNVLFESDETEAKLRQHIEQQIETAFGFPISVVLRTEQELQAVAAKCPFTKEQIAAADAASDTESLYVAFLMDMPMDQDLERLSKYETDQEQYNVLGRDIYLLFSDSVRNSKLAVQIQKLSSPSTVRNWKTVNKLLSLSEEMK